ncbi:DUF6251 family protein [Streptomyces sp. NPDC088258]|uniref:DUF6251 family protein n=1 Tax=Streptomyces sp. NPDC088258 TaxID=3365849 RepID=UPI0037F3042D
MEQFPAPRTVVQLPDGTHAYIDPHALPTPAPAGGPQIVHVHQAPPDRTVQRIALGSGVGAGVLTAGVYFGPLLVGVLTAMAANLALLALLAAVCAWGVVTVVKAVGPGTKQEAKQESRKGRG